jgi:hypothetical protein
MEKLNFGAASRCAAALANGTEQEPEDGDRWR